MKLRRKLASNHKLSTVGNQNTRELKGQLHPNLCFSLDEDRIKFVYFLSVLNGKQVLGHKLSMTDNPSNWERLCISTYTPSFFIQFVAKKVLKITWRWMKCLSFELWMCEWNGRDTWHWIKHSRCIQLKLILKKHLTLNQVLFFVLLKKSNFSCFWVMLS